MADDWKDILKKMSNDICEDKKETSSETDNSTEDESKNSATKSIKKSQNEPLKIFIDKKGRKGKTAVIIEGFLIEDEELQKVATKLKSKLGCGGSVRGSDILIQGDRKDLITKLLEEMGFKVKN